MLAIPLLLLVTAMAGPGTPPAADPASGVWPPAATAAAPAAPPPVGEPPPARGQPARPVAIVLALGIDGGSTKFFEVTYTDGSSESLRANQGLWASAGLAFLPVRAGTVTFDTAATLGVKIWSVGASNGAIKYLAVPLEVVERLWIGQFRLGAGASVALAPGISSSGLAAGNDVDFKNSLGLMAQAEWIGARHGGRKGMLVGARLLWQKLAPKDGGQVYGANAYGLYFGIEL